MLHSVQKLCAYIPFFESTTPESIYNLSLPYPEYDQTLYDFIADASVSKLMCTDYVEVIEKQGLNSPSKMVEAIDRADLNVLRAILTWVIRSERFCEGSWATALEEGVFLKILKRLQQLYPV